MSRIEMDLEPVSHITTDAIGKPGERVFYLQGRQDEQVVSLLIEKMQLQTLALGVEQFLAELATQDPDLSEPSPDYEDEAMRITPPVDPLFRIGDLGLGYDTERDLICLVAREVMLENQTEDDVSVVRFWCTRSQVLAMCRWGLEVVAHGRPICPQCGEPMELEGHFCPKKNGHKHD